MVTTCITACRFSGRVPSSAENGLDIRADGGYVIAPPSVHASGRRYEWDFTYAKDIADAPLWLTSLHENRGGSAEGQGFGPTIRPGRFPDVGLRPLAASTGDLQSPVPWSEAEQARLELALKYVDAKDYHFGGRLASSSTILRETTLALARSADLGRVVAGREGEVRRSAPRERVEQLRPAGLQGAARHVDRLSIWARETGGFIRSARCPPQTTPTRLHGNPKRTV